MSKILNLLAILGYFMSAPIAFAQGGIDLCPRDTTEFDFNVLCRLQPENAFPGLLTFVLIAAVVISLMFLIWGGIKWITSGGDKANVETARNHIVAAIVGLIVVFLAWFIINFILQTFFGGGLNQGISLPRIIGEDDLTPTPTISVTPPAASPSASLSPTPLQEVEGDTISPIPPCPTAYPPEFLCQMPKDNFK